MKRREFLGITLPATGAIILTPGCLNEQIKKEIGRQFSGQKDFDAYDMVINGAGLSGYFAAIYAAQQGKRVLVVDKRTSPGYEITAKRKLWLNSDGLDRFTPELKQLFFPENEKVEIHNDSGSGPNGSQFGDELLLFAGSIRKGMLRNLLVHKVHVLLMTEVCGILSDNENVLGVLLAGKHGLQIVKSRSFVDASDNVLFSRELSGNPYQVEKAGFILEVQGVKNPQKKEVNVSEEIGLKGNKIQLHQGKHDKDQLFIEFDFLNTSQKLDEIEHQSRMLSANLGKNFNLLDESLKEAKIAQFALECSVYLKNNELPDPFLKEYYLFPNLYTSLSCDKILEIEASAEKLVNNIQVGEKETQPVVVFTPGANIPFDEISLTEINEPGLAIPMKNCTFDFKTWANKKEQCQVLVAGGGTAGAMAGMAAAEKGNDTIVVDYFNDMGGTRTMGGVMGYYHGVKELNYFKKHNEDVDQVAFDASMTKKNGRKLYHLISLLNSGGRFHSGAIMCGTLADNRKVEGILICRNGKLELVQSTITIDATGDGDLAVFAGATFSHGNSRTGKTQNYSQRDIGGGAEKLPSSTSRDYDIIDNTKISEFQRGLFLSHYEAHFYDFYPMLTVRESRRIKGLYELDLIDAVEGTHFKDLIARASSDFDPHYVGSSEYSRCGFLLPHSNVLTLEIPYRSIVPKGLDGLLISGKAISQSHNALQFTRMNADIIVLGYLTGQIAADIASRNIQPKDYDISDLQKEWTALGFLPTDYATKKSGNLINNSHEIIRRVKQLAKGAPEYLYECVRLPKENVLPILFEYYNSTENHDNKLLIAKALAWFGQKEGNDLIEQELKDMFDQELKQGYPGGYVDTYDDIRGREKNLLLGLFWRINQNIALLGMTGNNPAGKTIQNILENTTSGGGMVERENEYFNGRIDLKIIPFHNRILNLCFYAERNPDTAFIPGFEKLLQDEYIGGFITEEYHLTRWRMYGGDLELFIGAALARCGSKTGYDLLITYLNDIHFNFKDLSRSELIALTGKDLGYNIESLEKDYRRHVLSTPPKETGEKDRSIMK